MPDIKEQRLSEEEIDELGHDLNDVVNDKNWCEAHGLDSSDPDETIAIRELYYEKYMRPKYSKK